MLRRVQTESGRRFVPCRAALPCSTSPAVVPAAAATAAAAAVTEAGAVVCLLPTDTRIHTKPKQNQREEQREIGRRKRGRVKEIHSLVSGRREVSVIRTRHNNFLSFSLKDKWLRRARFSRRRELYFYYD